MAIKTMSVGNSSGGQWSEGWHTLTISKAKYDKWNEKRVLDVYFDNYPDTFNMRIFEAFDKETHEEYALAKFFKLLNAGIIDKIKSPSGKEALQYDDDAEGLVGKSFNGLFYKDKSGYNKVSSRIAPVEQTSDLISYSADDVSFWKGVAEKHYNEHLKIDSLPNITNTPVANGEVTDTSEPPF